MLALIAALALTPVSYHIPMDQVPYNLNVVFDGYIPLLGGNEGNVDLKVGITVKGLSPEADGNARATTDISSLKILFNGATLPFGKEQVAKYFPNTVTLTPQGKVIKNDAPDLKLQIQLPGLDVQRFPDLTFLAVEFPSEGVEVGKPWTYSRQFGASDVNYTVTPTTVTDDKVLMDLKMSQDYVSQEDDAHNAAKDSADAVADVRTHVEGTGKVEFDRQRGLIRNVNLSANATSTVTDIKTKAVTTRKLKTMMVVSLQK